METLRLSLAGTYVVALLLALANFAKVPMNELYLIIQAMTVLASALLFVLNTYGTASFTASHLFMVSLLVAMAASLLVRMGLYAWYRSEGRHDQNRSAPMVRWDAFATGFAFFVFFTRAFYTSVPEDLWFKTGWFFLAVVVALPLVTFVPYAFGSPKVDLATAEVCMKLVEEVYEVRENAEADGKAFIHDPDTDVTAVVYRNGGTTYLCFNGSRSKENWEKNFLFTDQTLSAEWLGNLAPRTRGLPKVHRGFYESYMSVDERLLPRLSHPGRVVVAGHSLGGAMATLAALRLAGRMDPSRIELYTFGAPQVGDVAFASLLDRTVPTCVRFVNPHDPIPESLRMQLVHTKGYVPVSAPGFGMDAHGIEVYRKGIRNGRLYSFGFIVLPVSVFLIGLSLACWLVVGRKNM
jgi:triacylglycerol lipase